MSSSLDTIIQLGHDLTSIKRYSIGAFAVFFYDYLLTLSDEIEYAWSGQKSWAFWLFIANRYSPMIFQFWMLAVDFTPGHGGKVCERSSWFPLMIYVYSTLIAQIVLTLRAYAVTLKTISVLIGLAIITTSQFAVGLLTVVLASRQGVQELPAIPFDAYHVCLFYRHRSLQIVFTSTSLLYDSLVFSLIIFVVARSPRIKGFKVPGVLGTIIEDATLYFLVIFTSHFVFMLTLALARPSLQLLPGPGNIVLLPVMISRIMLSLKKAASPLQKGWSFGEPSTDIHTGCMSFFCPPRGTNTKQDDAPPDAYSEA